MVTTSYAGIEIMTGAEVYGSDGEKVGTVAEVHPGYVVVEKGFFFPTDYYIPRAAIASIDGQHVYLAVTKDAALGRGWDVRPVDLETASTPMPAGVATDSDRLAAEQVEATGEEIRVPVVEEELTASVHPQSAGAVRVEKDVVTEERSLEVPITEERVRVERRVVDRPATAADAAAFEEQVIEVPLRTEEVEVQKRPRVKEEVVITKEPVQHTERVRDTVRKEEVVVDEESVDAALLAEEQERRTSPNW